MSGKAFGWAREQVVSGGLAAKAVLLLIADYATLEGESGAQHCFPSVPTMAAELQASQRTVQRAIATLEADGLIARELRTTARGKQTSSRYVLALPARPEPGARREGCQPDTPRGDTVAPSGVTDSHHPPVTVSPSTTFEPLPDPSEFADAHSPGARDPIGSEEAFEAVTIAFAEASPTAVARPKDWAAWRRVLIENLALLGGDAAPATLLAAAGRYLAHVAADKRKPFSLARWLGDAKWEPFLAEPAKPAAATAIAPFEGPAELLAVLAGNGQRRWLEHLARSGCGFDAARRAIVCPTRTLADDLTGWFRRDLLRLQIEIIVERKAAA